MDVTPSQVSKAITRLEGALCVRLLTRGARGVALSEAGLRLAPDVAEAVARLNALQGGAEQGVERELPIAAPSWLGINVLPRVASVLRGVRLRAIELPPSLIRALAGENIFDLALLAGAADRLPATWVSLYVADLRKGLFAPPELARALGPGPVSAARVSAIPFVGHVYNANGTFVSVDDDCPLARGERTVGHEAQTFSLGLELATATKQLIFGPVLAARRHLERGELVEVEVEGWDVKEPLHVVCDGRRVLARIQAATAKAVREAVLALDPIGDAASPPAHPRGFAPNEREGVVVSFLGGKGH